MLENHQQERKKLSVSMNRLVDIQRNTDLENLHHTETSYIVARILQADDMHEPDHFRDVLLLWYVIKKEL